MTTKEITHLRPFSKKTIRIHTPMKGKAKEEHVAIYITYVFPSNDSAAVYTKFS